MDGSLAGFFDFDVLDYHFFQRAVVAVGAGVGDGVGDFLAGDYPAKNGVAAGQVKSRGHGDEELAAVVLGPALAMARMPALSKEREGTISSWKR